MNQREIKFRVNVNNGFVDIETIHKPQDGRGSHNFKGYEISGGYVLRKVKNHPKANSRGYYPEHRLVVEEKLGRLLESDEVVHHIDGNRKNNTFENLKVITQSEHAGLEMRGKRNANGTMVAKEPIFDEIKFRLHDSDRGITRIYTLSQLIGTTFRRGKFQFRGRWTGLKDKNRKEIYEGDVVQEDIRRDKRSKPIMRWSVVVYSEKGMFIVECLPKSLRQWNELYKENDEVEVIGNIYENPELLNNKN